MAKRKCACESETKRPEPERVNRRAAGICSGRVSY